MKSPRTTTLLRILALVLVVAVTVFIFLIRDRAEELAKFSYPGIFVLSILANGTVILPAPGVLFVFAMGAVFNPLLVAVVAGAGAAIGELSGYLAGFSGQAVIENTGWYDRIRAWMEKYPKRSYLVILIMSFIPNPFFDLAGIAAGALKMPVANFLFFCGIGKILKMFLFAYAGAGSLQWLMK